MTMLQLAGPAAETAFRLRRLQQQMRERVSGIQALAVRFEHFVHVDQPLSVRETDVLQALLRYGTAAAPLDVAQSLYVVPRLGTISPWASKATDIARICGVPVRRIERGRVYELHRERALDASQMRALAVLVHDRMTETCLLERPTARQLFAEHAPRSLRRVEFMRGGVAALEAANSELGLALSDEEIAYLAEQFALLGRDPTDVELMMFAQANSEHCRHKVFNAEWIIDGAPAPRSLFAMIKNTHRRAPEGVLSAYRDNAAVVRGAAAAWWVPAFGTGQYRYVEEPVHLVMKVETHNHPTAISPFPGAATGSGGEIRDEGATGRGAKPKAGLTGFTVSHLDIPGWQQPWDAVGPGRPGRIAAPLDIMLDGPIGAAQFNNEFGRPNLNGYFRSCLLPTSDGWRGYHKPIMLAGGLGSIRELQVAKLTPPVGARLVVLGGPAMLIGLGGGAASSLGSGAAEESLEFASVQRGNPEMQRRAQEVIDSCWGLGAHNPILSIHDVGAGGLSNALPEIVEQSGHGAVIELRKIPNDEPGMSPMEIWCNEAQERYVLAIAAEGMSRFEDMCRRERCPWAVLGELIEPRNLEVTDSLLKTQPVAMPLDLLFGRPPKMTRHVRRTRSMPDAWAIGPIPLAESLARVLRFPAVADKSFLIHIGDRSVGGLVARDQLVGPWQVPVSDCAVTAAGFKAYTGEAMAVGERTPVAIYDGPASARLAVTEAVLNIAAADVVALTDIRLSANWMAAVGTDADDFALYEMVRVVGEELCPVLGIAVPVGKDSLSMRTQWRHEGEERSVRAPVSLIVSAFAPVGDIRQTLTPELRCDAGATSLLLVDLAQGRQRLGGSCLAQVFGQYGGAPADLDDPERLQCAFAALRRLREAGLALAYHDRSDGGVLVTVLEMAFAAHQGLDIDIPEGVEHAHEYLFNEEPGFVIQVADAALPEVADILRAQGVVWSVMARPRADGQVRIRHGDAVLLEDTRVSLHRQWSELSFRMQALRDDPECAREAYDALLDEQDPGLQARPSFAYGARRTSPSPSPGPKPKLAVLREQGVNSQREMAAAFERAGFDPYDVHMSDLLAGRVRLAEFRGLAACGGFSYGDVLGAGEGWAKSILYNDALRAQFEAYFARPDIFVLGVCNGCQMLAALKSLIPGTAHWPRFLRNRSDQFEARLSQVRIEASPSVLLRGMEGSLLPIVTSHGEGRAEFDAGAPPREALTALRYVTSRGAPAVHYPANPNGSPDGIAGLCNDDGRITIMMPHPERVFRTSQLSWHPREWDECSPWLQLFDNARDWLGSVT
jgi:phosphoribosylformylglycinamidine synthase